MDKVYEHIEDELDGAMEYFSYYYEMSGNDVAEEIRDFAFDEMKHAKFFLDLLELRNDPKFGYYQEQYYELVAMFIDDDNTKHIGESDYEY